jgi:hypothetical protein
MVGLNQLMGSQPSPLDNWISNRNTYKQMMKKTEQICFHLKRQHIITNMNDNKSWTTPYQGQCLYVFYNIPKFISIHKSNLIYDLFYLSGC